MLSTMLLGYKREVDQLRDEARNRDERQAVDNIWNSLGANKPPTEDDMSIAAKMIGRRGQQDRYGK